MDVSLIIALLLGVSIFVTFAGLARVLSSPGEAIDDRLGRYATRENFAYTFVTEESLAEIEHADLVGWLDKRVHKRAEASGLLIELARADLKLTPGEWSLVTVGTIILMGILGLMIFRNPILAVGTAIVGLFLPRFYLRYRQRQRRIAFGNQLPDAIVLLANSLRAGYSLLQGMEVLSREMPPPISIEFDRVIREIGLGLTNEAALANLQNRIQSDDLDMMITAINIQAEIGGNMAEILDILAHTIRERVRIQGEIRVLTAQQTLSGTIISLLPAILSVILFILNPEYMSVLYKTTCGWIMLGAAALMVALGYFAMRKIMQIEV
ncbi:MAG: type II secretion system F family protein [Ardenticatenaceae bacterium]|nr:type II secretion system F family protein [Ardenticatenaceae bacterium]HBY95169.1 secretion system protein [Chloroflexota bacterium]